MKFVSETVGEIQNTSLEATVRFTDNFLIVVDRLTRLNIGVTRVAFEQSSEMAQLCLGSYLAEKKAFIWNTCFESGIERFSKYCQAVRQMAQEAEKNYR